MLRPNTYTENDYSEKEQRQPCQSRGNNVSLQFHVVFCSSELHVLLQIRKRNPPPTRSDGHTQPELVQPDEF